MAVTTIVLQDGGKILIGGSFTLVNGSSRNRIARLNANGSVDPNFDPETGANGDVISMGVQDDGKIVIGGFFNYFNGTTFNHIGRLQMDGSVDPDFDPGIGPGGAVLSIAIQNDGKLVIGGLFLSVEGVPRKHVARLNRGDSSGALDLSFETGAGPNGAVNAIEVQGDGKIIFGGAFTEVDGYPRRNIARINADGSVDPTFDTSTGPNKVVGDIALQRDRKVLITGGFTDVAGISRRHIARLSTNGKLDPKYDPGEGANYWVYSVELQRSGRKESAVIGGWFNMIDGVKRNHIARLYSDGSLDIKFRNGLTPLYGAVLDIATQDDGKLLIAGFFTEVNRTSRNRIARLRRDGSLDLSFDPGEGANDVIDCVGIQPDGKILIGGNFTTIDGVVRNRVARLNVDGSLDPTFNPGIGPSGQVYGSTVYGYVYSLAIQSNGQIVIGGYFDSVSGVTRNHIARLNADGTLDQGFDPDAGTLRRCRENCHSG